MKKKFMLPFLGLCLTTLMLSAAADDGILTKEKGEHIVNTTTLASDVRGYRGPTPLEIHIKSGKVVSIEPLSNNETPKHWAKVKKMLLDKWNGKTINQALKTEVDGVTGATLSSNAVKENVRRGLEYYKKNK